MVCVQIRGLIFEDGFLTFSEAGEEETEEELPPPVKPAISWCVRAHLSNPLFLANSSLCEPHLPHGSPSARRCFRGGERLPSVRYERASGRMQVT
jgi:hypothetical protein